TLRKSARDRIEGDSPLPVRLEGGSPDFLQKVVGHRLAVLCARAKLPEQSGSLEPLPTWFLPRIRTATSVPVALQEVDQFRERALRLGRIPSQAEYEEIHPDPVLIEDAIDFDKLWADHLDLAPATLNRFLVSTKAELIVWWASEASRE